MKLLDIITESQINELLKSINLKLVSSADGEKINNRLELSGEGEILILLFCEKIEKDEIDIIAQRIFGRMVGGFGSLYPDGPTLCLSEYSLLEGLHRVDYSRELYNFVMNTDNFDEKFKKQYKKGFINYYKNLFNNDDENVK